MGLSFHRVESLLLWASDISPKGHVLLTMRQGQGAQTSPDGQVFYLWPKADLMHIFDNYSLICVEYFEQQSKIRDSEAWMSFVLQSQA